MAFEEKEQDEGRIGGQGDAQRRRPQMHQAKDAADDRQGHAENDLPLGVGVAVGEEHQPPDGEGEGQDGGQLRGDPRVFHHMGVIENHVSRVPPPQAADKAECAQTRGQVDGKPGRRQRREGPGGGHGIGAQDKIKQRNLLGEGGELRSHQGHVFNRDAEQPDDGFQLGLFKQQRSHLPLRDSAGGPRCFMQLRLQAR